jgi:hypothetical protein
MEQLLRYKWVLLETKFLGLTFSLTRWLCNFIGILLIAFCLNRLLSDNENRQSMPSTSRLEPV